MVMYRPLLLLLALPLVACGDGSPPPRRVVSAPPPVTGPVHPAAPRKLAPQVLPGLEGVIGASSEDLVRQFGPARLDVWEGDARKLQFVGTPCVLDVYLYPAADGREPQASHVDARRASDGRDVDRAACIAALRKR